MRNKLIILLSFFLLAGCGEEKSLPKAEVYKIREIGELSSTEYVFSKVIRIDDPGEWYKFGDRKILLSCKAKVKAGIDLRKIQDGDIVENGEEINITLPKSRITTFDMDPNSVKVEVMDVDGFRSGFNQDDINKILQMGEKSIRAALPETGIYQEAEKNAISFIQEFYAQLGYSKVNVIIRTDNEK
jgi:hypothetical protein